MATHTSIVAAIGLRIRVAVLSLPAFLSLAGAETQTRVDYRDLASGKAVVIGALGVPLGTLVTAEVEVLSKPAWFGKTDRAYYWLRVHAVNGAALPDKPEVPYHTRLSTISSVNGSLVDRPSELLTDEERRRLAPDFEPDVRRVVEKDYVGTRHTIICHEEAAAGGYPPNRSGPVGAMIGGMRNFEFGTFLIVGAEDIRTRLTFARWRELLAEKDERSLPAARETLPDYLRKSYDGYFLHFGLTTDVPETAKQFRRAMVEQARSKGFDAASLERCLDALERRPLPEKTGRVMAGAFAVGAGAEPGWVLVAKHFQSAVTQSDREMRVPRYGLVEWWIAVADEVVLYRAADASMIAEAASR